MPLRPSLLASCALLLTFPLLPLTAHAACLPLPDRALAPLDAALDTSPRQALTAAQARLAQMAPAASQLLEAQLYAIVAQAQGELDQPDAATAAITKGLALLPESTADEARSTVRLRLQLLQAELQSTTGAALVAAATLDKLLPSIADDSRELACALSQRAIAYDFLDEPDRAVDAALAAHRLAVEHGWAVPRVDSAYTLAVNFRRAGLYDQAEKMIDEVIAVETANDLRQNIGEAHYERGQLLVAAGRFAEARTALAAYQTYAEAAGDPLSTAANVPLCLAELNDHDLAAADVTCNSSTEAFSAAGRVDLATLLESYRARLDLEHDQPAKALTRLDRIVAGPIHELLPVQEAQIYRDRARAHGDLRRYPEAYADLSHALELDAASGIERRHREVAVLSALVESERLRNDNRLLQANLRSRQQDLLQQQRARVLWRAVAATSIIACGLLVWLVIARKRNSRRLRRYHVILSRAWSRAPHAMLLLDEQRLVCFANRPLLGEGPAPVVGAALVDVVPDTMRAQITHAIDGAFRTGQFVSLDVAIDRNDGHKRYYEVYVFPAIDAGEALGVTLQSIDVTDLRSAERQFVDGTSLERQMLGDELHEGLAQELAGVLFMLNNLAKKTRGNSAGFEQLLAEASEQVSRSISLARRLAQDIAPITIDRGSLADALRRLTESAAIRLGVSAFCECSLGGREISNLAADHVHQFCRDALIQAVLDQACHQVRLQLSFVQDSLVVHLAGQRRAIPSVRSVRPDVPTKMIAFRARLLGGSLRWGPNRDGEFCMTLTVPAFQLEARIENA